LEIEAKQRYGEIMGKNHFGEIENRSEVADFVRSVGSLCYRVTVVYFGCKPIEGKQVLAIVRIKMIYL
jgi:hypothetical protein